MATVLRNRKSNESTSKAQNGTDLSIPPQSIVSDKKRKTSPPFKVFEDRDSLYSNLLATPNGAAIVNVFLCLSVFMCILNFAFNYAQGKRFTHTIEGYIYLVGYPHQWIVPLATWLGMFVGYITIYPCFLIWARFHCFLPRVMGTLFGLLYFFYQLAVFVLITKIVFEYNISFHLGGALGCEQIRMLMKSYSFIRENARKVLSPWKTTDEIHKEYKGQLSPELANFNKFMYFFFAPTMLYRDSYPRLKKRNYKRLLWHAGEFVWSQIIALMIGATFIEPSFRMIPTDPVRYLVLTIVLCGTLGPFFVICVHIAVIHAPYNAWAEITKFADRRFYEDWWTCTDYRSHYKKWHLVIHEWLRNCVQEDLKKIIRNRLLRSALPVLIIFLSSCGHDFVYCLSTRFFMPSVTMFFLVCGSIMYFLSGGLPYSQFSNFLLLFSFLPGIGLALWPYLLETYARDVCPVEPTFSNVFNYQFTRCILPNDTGGTSQL